jgi:outer membrane protein TolC
MSDQLQAKNALELVMALLARNVGVTNAFSLREDPMVVGEVPELVFFRDQAFLSRADLKSLEVQKQIAAKQTRYAEGAFWPTVSLAGVYVGTDSSPAPASLIRDSTYGNISLNFPLFEEIGRAHV